MDQPSPLDMDSTGTPSTAAVPTDIMEPLMDDYDKLLSVTPSQQPGGAHSDTNSRQTTPNPATAASASTSPALPTYMTPEIVSVAPQQGQRGDTLTVTLKLPPALHDDANRMQLIFNNTFLNTKTSQQEDMITLTATVPYKTDIDTIDTHESHANMAICTLDYLDAPKSTYPIGQFTYIEAGSKRSSMYNDDNGQQHMTKKRHSEEYSGSTSVDFDNMITLMNPYDQEEAQRTEMQPTSYNAMLQEAIGGDRGRPQDAPMAPLGHPPQQQQQQQQQQQHQQQQLQQQQQPQQPQQHQQQQLQQQQQHRQPQQHPPPPVQPPPQQQQPPPPQPIASHPQPIMPKSEAMPATSSYGAAGGYSMSPPNAYGSYVDTNYAPMYMSMGDYLGQQSQTIMPAASAPPLTPPQAAAKQSYPMSMFGYAPNPPSTVTAPPKIVAEATPFAGLVSRPQLTIQGDLMDITKDWNPDEWKAKRRVVQFWRKQLPGEPVIECGYTVIHEEQYRADKLQWQRQHQAAGAQDPLQVAAAAATSNAARDNLVVSCIYWEAQHDYFITSVDCIQLIEGLIGVEFTVEEKNRIRRNLEALRPLTAAKARADSAEFFKLIMGYPAPKPRNIEKDVKVFLWSTLGPALKKIVGKYTPSYSSTASVLNVDTTASPAPQLQANHGPPAFSRS